MTHKSNSDRLSPRFVAEMLYRYDKTRSDHNAWQQEAQLQRQGAQHLIAAHITAFSTDADGMPLDAPMPKWIDMQMHIPALMLAAYSVELMLKALIIKRDPSAVDIEHHDLIKLATSAGLGGKFDARVLEKLTEYSTWRGRYPTSKVPNKKRGRGCRT